jgi:hypothetical protein
MSVRYTQPLLTIGSHKLWVSFFYVLKDNYLVQFDFPSICSKAKWLLPRKIAIIVVQGPLKDCICRVSRPSREI